MKKYRLHDIAKFNLLTIAIKKQNKGPDNANLQSSLIRNMRKENPKLVDAFSEWDQNHLSYYSLHEKYKIIRKIYNKCR